MILDKTERVKKQKKSTQRMRQTDVWPQWKSGRPRDNMKRVLILGQKIQSKRRKKADARTDRKRHALQETKLDGNLGEASATLDQRH
jgi:hypothetical protein